MPHTKPRSQRLLSVHGVYRQQASVLQPGPVVCTYPSLGFTDLAHDTSAIEALLQATSGGTRIESIG